MFWSYSKLTPLNYQVQVASNILKYFELQSASYNRKSEGALWNWQRSREALAVGQLVGDVTGATLLDLGCGSGFYTRFFRDLGTTHITAVDLSPAMVAQLPKDGVTRYVSDASTFQTKERFDRIVLAGLLEFVPSPAEVLKNARRLIEPDGFMVCLVPPDNWAGKLYRSFHRGHGFNINLFSGMALIMLAEQGGWHVNKTRFVFPYSLVVRLSPDTGR